MADRNLVSAEEEPAPVIPRIHSLPATGWVSSRQRRLRGIQDSSVLYDPDASEEEKFLHEHYAKQHG